MRRQAAQALRFGMVGTVGFAVDGGILTLLYNQQGVQLLPARLCSFAVAVTVTWLLNRWLTFPECNDNRVMRQWLRYAAVNGLGALLNLGLFLWLVHRFATLGSVPLLALAIASLVAMSFNFVASRYVAFRGLPT